ncbi:RNA-directed DNA polymerase from mobile element jockey [Trichonephila clavipes]|nr:RNA-directed DNA polymerase from mobile element jockey [Trichonephila clavipes]
MILSKFPTYLIKIIHSFLENRTFKVKLNNVLPSQRPILASIPQGSILSPALYNIYTCDFPTNNNITVCLFADDAAILYTRNTVEEAINLTQNYILKLQIWLTKWRIVLNTEKSHAIYSGKPDLTIALLPFKSLTEQYNGLLKSNILDISLMTT